MSKVYLLENIWSGEYKAFSDLGDTLKFVMSEIEKREESYEDKFAYLKELITSIAERDEEKWGKGFAIDEMYYCWQIDYVENKRNEVNTTPFDKEI